MKISDISIIKETMADGSIGLACRVTMENGEQIADAHPWRNARGLWASDSDAREPAEIAAVLRAFAAAIERATEQANAA